MKTILLVWVLAVQQAGVQAEDRQTNDLDASPSAHHHFGLAGLPPATGSSLYAYLGGKAQSPYAAYGPDSSSSSTVHRNPYEGHNVHDAIRTQDADLAPYNPYTNPALATAHAYGPGHRLHVAGYEYDQTRVPECAFTNRHYYNLTFCLQDNYYPTDTIHYELDRNRALVQRLLSDISYQSADNLVDGLTKPEEEGYTYQHYYGDTKFQQYGADYHGYSYADEYYKDGGYICPSDIFYGRPKRAINTYGQWKVIVNLPDEHSKAYEKFAQTQRLEQCMYPTAPCSYLDHKYRSQCLQKHNFVRMLAYTHEEGLHIDSFKLPIACSCHIAPSHPLHFPFRRRL